ncbi:MAG TPA: amino acid racemase [bacterium]|jgi:aspartate racemase|nr:amino acid racemase [bacterium]
MHRTIGVLGGLGPWATLDFFEKVLRLTPARRDQEHLRLIIDNNPKIPDRGPAILGSPGAEDPFPALAATARAVEAAGADFIVIPCNTAHFFYEPIRRAVRVPVLHIMEEVARAAAARLPGLRRVGLLGTRATVATGLYQAAFASQGTEVVAPESKDQAVIDGLIYGIKAGRADELAAEGASVGRRLGEAGAEAIILGCTELPLVLGPETLGLPVLDSNLILAEAAVREATVPETVSPEVGA